jgi:hypothetical protein
MLEAILIMLGISSCALVLVAFWGTELLTAVNGGDDIKSERVCIPTHSDATNRGIL